MLHIEKLDAPENYLIRSFADGLKYGDRYDAEFIVSINADLGFIEVHGLNGRVSREDYIYGIKYLRGISKQYNLPVVAERTGKHKLPFFILNGGWWFLK